MFWSSHVLVDGQPNMYSWAYNLVVFGLDCAKAAGTSQCDLTHQPHPMFSLTTKTTNNMVKADKLTS